MCDITSFLLHLYEYVTNTTLDKCKWGIIRRHTKNLEQSGDISFPLTSNAWQKFRNKEDDVGNINSLFSKNCDVFNMLNKLVVDSRQWQFEIYHFLVQNNNVHLFLNKSTIFRKCIRTVLNSEEQYGSNVFHENVLITLPKINDCNTASDSNCFEKVKLTELRLVTLHKVLTNVLVYASKESSNSEQNMCVQLTTSQKGSFQILCGPIVNSFGVKDVDTTADQLIRARQLDLQLMAQHRYGIQVKPTDEWNKYFYKLGKAAVTLEVLQNKHNKKIQITLNDITFVHHNASFVFYNCARIAKLLKKFDVDVSSGIYPNLPPIEEIDFTTLNKPEEWELLYVYIVQFPCLLDSCISDIVLGNVNIHYLVTFLSNLSSAYSSYYHRVKILVKPKEQLLRTLFARIYLLKCIRKVFHTILFLLDIEPIDEM